MAATTGLQLAVESLLDSTATSIASTVASSGTRAAVARVLARSGRTKRLGLYEELQETLFRARYRLEVLMNAHTALTSPLSVVQQFSGFPVIVGLLERLADDLARLTVLHQQIARQAPQDVEDAARDAMLRVVGRMSVTTPAFYRPFSRRRARTQVEEARSSLSDSTNRLALACLSDAGPTYRARRAAKRELLEAST